MKKRININIASDVFSKKLKISCPDNCKTKTNCKVKLEYSFKGNHFFCPKCRQIYNAFLQLKKEYW